MNITSCQELRGDIADWFASETWETIGGVTTSMVDSERVCSIKILLSDLTIFGAKNRAKMTVLGFNLMEWPDWLH